MNTINIDELQETISFLLSKLKERCGNTITLQNDYYWDFDDKELYDVYNAPKDFSIGQLSFDWERINGKDKDDLTPYSITNISHILKAISIENPIVF